MADNKIKIEKIEKMHRIEINGQAIVGTYEELEELCLALEEYLYDEPTYEELSREVLDLKLENEKLERELSSSLRGLC